FTTELHRRPRARPAPRLTAGPELRTWAGLLPDTRSDRGGHMNPLKASAQFAAYVWYTEVRQRTTRDEALRFAERNWTTFLPAAHEGWGQLLMRVARPGRTEGGRVRRRRAERPARA